MTQPPTPDSDRRDPLGFDEILALLIAFSAIGGVLWWGFGRSAERLTGRLDGKRLLGTEQLEASPEVTLSPTDAAVSGTAVVPVAPPSVMVSPTAVAAPQANAGVSRTVVIAGAVAPVAVAPPVAPAVQPPVIVIPSPAAEARIFPDVPNGYWAYPFIAGLSQRGLIAGTNGNFQPDQPVNRAQYAALLGGVLNSSQQAEIPFKDVPAGFWGNQSIDKAVKAGFLKGYPDESFQPEQPITKMQVLLSLANGFNLPKPADPEAALQSMASRDQIPAWAKPAVGAAAQSNVIVSYPNVQQFQPDQPATRAEVAAMLYQALRTRGDLPLVQSNYILRP